MGAILERCAWTMQPSYQQVWAACPDAATRHMRANGRTAWNSEDYEVAVKELQRLWPEPRPTERLS